MQDLNDATCDSRIQIQLLVREHHIINFFEAGPQILLRRIVSLQLFIEVIHVLLVLGVWSFQHATLGLVIIKDLRLLSQ